MKRYLLLLVFLLVPFTLHAQAENCFCVTYARSFSPNIPSLDAEYWRLLPQKFRSTPQLGGQILIKYWSAKYQTWIWHVGTIVEFGALGFIVDDRLEMNGECKTGRRVISYIDSRVVSFFNF